MRQGAVVTGPLRLNAADTIGTVFKCRDCIFAGAVSVEEAKFARSVDLSGSTFEQRADFRGVEFDAPALLRNAKFKQRADFSLTLFQDLSSFSEAKFHHGAKFEDSRFEDAAFIASHFSSATFDGVTFRGAARFHGAIFEHTASFHNGDFRQRSDFSLARFKGGATFTGAQLGDDASFLGAYFSAASPSAEAATFQSVSAAHDLNFTFATFTYPGKPNKDRADYVAFFGDVVCGGSLIFDDTTFTQGPLDMQRLQTHDLALDVDVAAGLENKEQRRNMLRLIEASAKDRGDLVTANNAHYALRVDESADYALVPHALDYVFYRGIAGYFVRPFRPLLILFGIVALLSLLKTITDERSGTSSEGPVLRRGRRVWLRSRRGCGTFLTCFLDKLGLIRPQRGDTAAALTMRLESFAYRLLVVCAVLGLANSNPTLRQMVETLL